MAEPEKKEPAKRSKVKLIIFIAVPLVLAGGGVFGYFQWKTGQDKKAAEEKMKQVQAGQGVKKDEAFAEVGKMSSLGSFILNLNTPGDSRYLKVSITGELSDDGVEEEIARKKPIIDDIFVSHISAKAFDEIADDKGKSIMKEELLEKLNKYLMKGRVTRLYFTEFVVQ